jgi:hypothetical protein
VADRSTGDALLGLPGVRRWTPNSSLIEAFMHRRPRHFRLSVALAMISIGALAVAGGRASLPDGGSDAGTVSLADARPATATRSGTDAGAAGG